jgi:hypothetical protein
MIFAALENDAWDDLPPRELLARLQSNQFRPPMLTPWKEGQLPSTFAFRTREGGAGILQLVELPKDRPSVTLRYKLIRRQELH